MWKWNLNVHNKHSIHEIIETYLIKRSSKCLKGFFYIECKVKSWCLTILWKSRGVGGEGIWTWKSWGEGGSSSFGNPGGWGIKKSCLHRGGVDFFWNNLLQLGGSMGSKGWPSGESAHLPPIWPGFKGHYVGWSCCWFSPLLREVFSPGTPVFPSC